MEHSFNTNVAKEYDVDIAILLNNFKHWTIVNLANKRNIHDGLCWTFNTIPAFCKIFNYWTRHQIEHLLKKAKTLGLIVSGNYNNHRYDRTRWYALTAKAYKLFPELCEEDYFVTLSKSISEKSEISVHLPTISENSEMLLWKNRDAALENPRPIPDINTDNKPNNKHIEKAIISDFPVETKCEKVKNSNKLSFTVNDLLADNPHGIPEAMLEDWLTIRKDKKARVTQTAWVSMNNTLLLIQKKANISPIDAFEKMVANAWQSLELKYFVKGTNEAPKTPLTYGTGRPNEGEITSWS